MITRKIDGYKIAIIMLFILVCIGFKDAIASQAKAVNNDNLVEALIKLGEHSDDPELKRRSLELKKAKEKKDRALRQVIQSQNEWEIWREVERIKASRAGKEMFQEVVNGIKKDFKVDVVTAHHMASKNSLEAQKVWKKMQVEEDQKLYGRVAQSLHLENVR